MPENPNAFSPSTRVIYAVFDQLSARRKSIVAALILLVVVAVLSSGVYVVKKEERAVLVRFGKMVDSAVQPGIHYALPFVERAHVRKVMRITRRSVATRDEAGGIAFSMLSGDANLFEADVVLQYRIGDLGTYLYATADPETILALIVRERLVWLMGQHFIDLIFTSNRDVIQAELFELTSNWLKDNNVGIELLALTIVELRPVEETVAAFRDVSDAIAESIRVVSDAQRLSERLLARSRGQAEAVVADAKARAQERRLQATASAQAFRDMLATYRNRPASVTVTRYWQRMRTVFADATLSTVGPGGASAIDINMVDGFVPGPGLLTDPVAGVHGPRTVARSDDRAGGRDAYTTVSEMSRHGFENVEADRHLILGRRHSPISERHHLGTARARSLIFDDLSIFGHSHITPSRVAAEAERNEPPIASGTVVPAEDGNDRARMPTADKAGHGTGKAGHAGSPKAGAGPTDPKKTDEAQRRGRPGGKTDGPAD